MLDAHQGQRDWSAWSPRERERALRRLADLVEAHAEPLAAMESRNCGRQLRQARKTDDQGSIDALRYFAGYPTRQVGAQIPMDTPRQLRITLHQPLGVIAAIAPWNLPSLVVAGKVAVRARRDARLL